PPAYGHSPAGKAWRLERDLWPLLEDCVRLLDPDRYRLLVTGHSPQVDADDVVDFLLSQDVCRTSVDRGRWKVERGRSGLTDRCGRRLDTGFYVRVCG
ncbi:MAG: SAM-dependent methyltransferase, partial [Planctomycetota bacterium]